MRQVNEDELVYIIQSAMRDWKKTLLKDFHHYDPDRRFQARVMAARMVAREMQRLEILSGGCEPPGFRCINPNAEPNPVAYKPGTFDWIKNTASPSAPKVEEGGE